MTNYLPPPSSLPPGSIVDTYRRDSGGTRQEQSTDQQLKQLQDYCAAHGLLLRHNFVDEAKSGGSTIGRDDFNRMIDTYRLPEQRPAGLILWNYARFARDFDNAVYYKALLRTYHITVHSLNDPVPEGDYGRIIELFIDLSNEEKRRQTSADARRGLRELVQKYGCVPGTPPRGFKRQPVTIGTHRDNTPRTAHRWVPDPDLVPTVQRAFAMRAAGQSLAAINDQTRLFGSVNSYKTFFTNRLYIGILDFGDLVIENYCEPLIELPTWKAVQKIIQAHAERFSPSSSGRLHPKRIASSYLLSGLAICGHCGSPLWGMTSGQRNGNHYQRYACTRAKRRRDCGFKPVPTALLEQAVLADLRVWSSDPSNLAELLDAERQQTAQLHDQQKSIAKKLQKELASLRRSIKRITSAISESGHSKSLLAELNELETKETNLQSRLLRARSQTPELPPPLHPDEIAKWASNLYALLSAEDRPSLRAVLNALVHSVIVTRNGQEVHAITTFKRLREPETSEPDPARHTAPTTHTTVESQDGQGTAFLFTLPLATQQQIVTTPAA